MTTLAVKGDKLIIKGVETKHYLLPLTHPMTDASHGVMTHFEVVLVRLQTDCGSAGHGYTYTIGCGGAAIRSLIEVDLKSVLLGADANCIEASGRLRELKYSGVDFNYQAAYFISVLLNKKENHNIDKLLANVIAKDTYKDDVDGDYLEYAQSKYLSKAREKISDIVRDNIPVNSWNID